MKNKNREIKTAILVLSSIFLFIWGYSFLKSKDLFQSGKTIYVVYDNVDGLLPKSAVTLNGLTIGNIEDITFLNHQGKLLVTMQIDSDFPISKGSIAKIYEPGLIGGKQIAIVPDFKNKALLKTGDTLQSGKVAGLTEMVAEKLFPLEQKIESATVSADSLIKNINKILNQKNREEISKSLASLTETLSHIKAMAKNADDLLVDNKAKIDNTIKNIDKTTANFSKLSDTLAKANIGKTIKSLENTLATTEKMMKDLESGKGSAGKLLKDDALYNNLSGASKELELLLADMKNNPKRYVHFSLFGKKPKPYEGSNVAPK